jgi:hypothetical protein
MKQGGLEGDLSLGIALRWRRVYFFRDPFLKSSHIVNDIGTFLRHDYLNQHTPSGRFALFLSRGTMVKAAYGNEPLGCLCITLPLVFVYTALPTTQSSLTYLVTSTLIQAHSSRTLLFLFLFLVSCLSTSSLSHTYYNTATQMETSSSSTPAPILTLTSVDILLGLARLDPSAQHSALSLPLQTHLSTISQDWQDPSALNAFLGLQRFIRPAEEMEEWEPALVPAVALLSAALYGRGQVDGAFELVVQVCE